MCGFAGQLDLNGLAGSPQGRMEHLQAMGRQLARRGPDDEQFYDDGYLSLVYRRLSIIDLDGGQQPIWNEDRSKFTVVNGEIYNHQDIRARISANHEFRSQSDSEVVIHLFEDRGHELMQELNGMFALLVWDSEKRELLLARDRLGIKPLFFAVVDSTLFFASELKALLAHPDCPGSMDWRDFGASARRRFNIPTFVNGVHHLPGGYYLHLQRAGQAVEPRAYWNIRDHFPADAKGADRRANEYSSQYGELLHDSVQRQLMSDVPLGLFLSGGIDSSLLAAMAGNMGKDLHCFTVVEDSTLDAGDVEQARRVTSELGLSFYPMHYDANTALDALGFDLGQMEFLIWAMESPHFRLEWLIKHELHRFAKTHIPGLKVMLLGQGADEFAGGYSQSMGNESQSWAAYHKRISNQHLEARRANLGIPPFMLRALSDDYPPAAFPAGMGEYHQHMVDRTIVLQRYNLWHEDRSSSSQSVEARVPFLDHRLVELLASVPAPLHPELFFDKSIVRDQLARSLPSYPRDKLKVKFYSTGNDASTNKIRLGLIQRCFPDFREKYLVQPGAIFSSDRMSGFYKHITSGGQAEKQDLDDFLNCMSITIFSEMCQNLARNEPPPPITPPSPLQTWQPD